MFEISKGKHLYWREFGIRLARRTIKEEIFLEFNLWWYFLTITYVYRR